jgi:hypothetical protein
LHFRHARHAAHKHQLIDVFLRHLGILQA